MEQGVQDQITYVYQAYARDNLLLYVGITDDLAVRVAQHERDKFWWRRDVVRISHVAFETRMEALWAEWAVIAMCRPVYNRRLSPPRPAVTPAAEVVAQAGPDCFPSFAQVVKFWESSPAPVEPAAAGPELNEGQRKVLAAIRAGHQKPTAIMSVTGYQTTHTHAVLNSLIEKRLIRKAEYGKYRLLEPAI